MNLPAKPKATPPRKGAFSRALERFAQERARPAASPASLRAQEVAPPDSETISISAICAVTGGAYRVLYARDPAHGKYVPLRQEKIPPAAPTSASRSSAQESTTQEGSVPMSEFHRLSHLPCPYCAKKVVHVDIRCGGCGRWVCTGRSYIDLDGELIFVCHELCGRRSALNGPSLTHIKVEQTPRRTEPKADAISTKPKKALTHEHVPLLPFGGGGKKT